MSPKIHKQKQPNEEGKNGRYYLDFVFHHFAPPPNSSYPVEIVLGQILA